MTPEDPSTRYREYLRSFGIVDAGDRVAELRDLDLGGVRFFAYAVGAGLRLKAAVTRAGVVTPGGHAGDDWYGFLSQLPDAISAADRIAWLETDASAPPHGFPRAPAVALAPDRRPPPGVDPAQWALVTPPSLTEPAPGRFRLVAWLLASGSRVPESWIVTARRDAPADVERATASALLAVNADGIEAAEAAATQRALRLLVSGTDDERVWALGRIGDTADRAAIPPISALLTTTAASPDVRLLAAGTLARLADPAAVTPLGTALRADPSPAVRRACAQALGRIGGASALQALVAAVSAEADVAVRVEIVQALAAQGHAARGALSTIAASDSDATIRELARGSIEGTG